MPTCPTCGRWLVRQDLIAASGDVDAPRDRCPDDGTVVLVGSASPETRAAMEARFSAQVHAKDPRTPDERDAESAAKLQYVNDWDDGFAMLGAWALALVLALGCGLVLLVVHAIVGRPTLAAIVGTIVGVVGGAVLVPVLFFGADFLVSMLVRPRADSRRVREAGRTAFTWITVGVFFLPVLITVVVSLALS